VRKVLLTASAALVLFGCEPQKQEAKSPPPANSELGRWVVIPAASQPYTAGNPQNIPLFSAWRLDTKTGALEMCNYDPGGESVNIAESLACSKAAEATPTN
jgi:hypothetical protein